MDCRTARQLLDFHRPRASELDPAETRALQEHLATCSDCESLVRGERQVDDVIGRAMREIDAPDQFRERLLSRLAADRAQLNRGRYERLAPIAAAAAVLICCLAGYALWSQRATVVNDKVLEDYWTQVKESKFSPPDAEALRRRFKGMGVEAAPPANLNLRYLAAYGLGDFLGQQVPQMVFVRDAAGGAASAHAQVLILPAKQFNADSLAGDWRSEEGYPYRVEAVKDATLPQVYVIFHTGDDVSWLEQEPTS